VRESEGEMTSLSQRHDNTGNLAYCLSYEYEQMSPGRMLILGGIVLVVVGVLWLLGEKIGLGRLPGDIVVRGERTTFYFPLATCVVLSVVLSLVLWLIERGGR
jgi:hypothetical protein